MLGRRFPVGVTRVGCKGASSSRIAGLEDHHYSFGRCCREVCVWWILMDLSRACKMFSAGLVFATMSFAGTGFFSRAFNFPLSVFVDEISLVSEFSVKIPVARCGVRL